MCNEGRDHSAAARLPLPTYARRQLWDPSREQALPARSPAVAEAPGAATHPAKAGTVCLCSSAPLNVCHEFRASEPSCSSRSEI